MKNIVDLKNLRDREGLKQSYLAKKMKISASYLSQLENYERKVRLDDFLNALDILGYEFMVRKKGDKKMEVVKNVLNESVESVEDIKECAFAENNESIVIQDGNNKEYCDIIKKVTDKLSDVDFFSYEKYKFILEEAIKVSNELEFVNVSKFLEGFRLNCENGIFENVSVRFELESIYYITKYKKEFYKEINLFIEYIKNELKNIDTELELEDRNKKMHNIISEKLSSISNRISFESIEEPYNLSLVEVWDDLYWKTHGIQKNSKKVTFKNYVYEYSTQLCFVDNIDMDNRLDDYDSVEFMSVSMKTGELIINNDIDINDMFDEESINKIKKDLIKITEVGFDVNNKIRLLFIVEDLFLSVCDSIN